MNIPAAYVCIYIYIHTRGVNLLAKCILHLFAKYFFRQQLLGPSRHESDARNKITRALHRCKTNCSHTECLFGSWTKIFPRASSAARVRFLRHKTSASKTFASQRGLVRNFRYGHSQAERFLEGKSTKITLRILAFSTMIC